MSESPVTRILAEINGRELTVHLSERTEKRLRAFLARVNADMDASPHFGPDDLMGQSDADLAIALTACADRGLEADELGALDERFLPSRRSWRRLIGGRR